jgi:hypothetical protein
MMPLRRPFAALVLLVALAPTPALAQQVSAADRALARDLAMEGYDALDRKDYPTAVERFGRADALFHVASVALGLARAQVGIGQLVNAQETYGRIVREGVPAGAPAALVKAVSDAGAELAAVRPRIAGVIITVLGATGVTVTLDGAPVSTAALGVRLPADPGKHVIRATAPGFVAAEATLTLADGKGEAVTLQLRPEATPQVTPAPRPAPVVAPSPLVVVPALSPTGSAGDATAPRRARQQRIAGITLMAAGGVGGVLGAVFAAQAHSKYAALNALCPSHVGCSPDLASSLSSYHAASNASVASFVAGGALLGTGVIVYLTAPKARPPARAFVAPRIGAGYLGLEGGFW